MKITKKQIKHIINQYKDRYIDFQYQKDWTPDHIVYDYIHWIHNQWHSGLINIHEYRKLINVDILTA